MYLMLLTVALTVWIKTLFSTGCTTCEPHAAHNESRTEDLPNHTGVRRLPHCPAAGWICVYNPFCSQTGDALLCCSTVENFKSPQRWTRDSEKTLTERNDWSSTDLLSHRLYSWWEWLPKAIILIQNNYCSENALRSCLCWGVVLCSLCQLFCAWMDLIWNVLILPLESHSCSD